MTAIERIHNDAFQSLTQARRDVEKLTSASSDWTAGLLVKIRFDALEEAVVEFGRYQCGLQAEYVRRGAKP